jgi:Tfp pilus assembly protein PilF
LKTPRQNCRSPQVATQQRRGFEKLLGRADNYLTIHDGFDVKPLIKKITGIPQSSWRESGRERRFEVHRATETLLLIQFEDGLHTWPEALPSHQEFAEELSVVTERISAFYRDRGFVVRMLFAKLLAGGSIPMHSDSGYSLLNCHRIHIPLITTEDVIFHVGGEDRCLLAGEFCEIDNSQNHAVENRGRHDRIHLIVDWMPNQDDQPMEEITAPQLKGLSKQREQLNRMVARAHQLHQSGQLDDAEAAYQEILETDKNHVIANNLLGLLCIHTERFEQAEGFLGTALQHKPDDAQTHANLGFALKRLDRFAEAADHLQSAVKLAPEDAVSHLDLGNVYRDLGQSQKAIASYQQALVIRADYAEAHQNLGSALLALGQFDEARASLIAALEIKPDLSLARINLERTRNR